MKTSAGALLFLKDLLFYMHGIPSVGATEEIIGVVDYLLSYPHLISLQEWLVFDVHCYFGILFRHTCRVTVMGNIRQVIAHEGLWIGCPSYLYALRGMEPAVYQGKWIAIPFDEMLVSTLDIQF